MMTLPRATSVVVAVTTVACLLCEADDMACCGEYMIERSDMRAKVK